GSSRPRRDHRGDGRAAGGDQPAAPRTAAAQLPVAGAGSGRARQARRGGSGVRAWSNGSMTPKFQPRRPSHDRWLVSYADFSTLLFALFATMYAISHIDATPVARATTVMQAAFPDGGRSVVPATGILPEHAAPRKTAAGPEPGDDVREIVSRELAN